MAAFPVRSAADDADLRRDVPRAIKQAQLALFATQAPSGQFAPGEMPGHADGVHSLVLLALLSSGVPPEENHCARGLAWLRDREVQRDTYDLGLSIMALAAGGDKKRDFGKISAMVRALEGMQLKRGGAGDGAWGYNRGGGWWDNSNTQYAVLGLRDAEYFGVPVDADVWRRSQGHWLRVQSPNRGAPRGAGWSYDEGQGSYGSMTVAGVASLTITSMFVAPKRPLDELPCCGADPQAEVQDAVAAGERWLGTQFSVKQNPGKGSWLLYYLYGLERAGRLTGRRFFGDHDWYREGARHLVKTQLGDGSWVGEGIGENKRPVGTSLSLLFLSKGLAPVLINKLRYGPPDVPQQQDRGGPWNRHGRDVRNLTDHLTTRPGWPKLMTWQEVDLTRAANEDDLDALLQAPVQVLEGDSDLSAVTPAARAMLREYVAQGGFLFLIRNCDSPQFDAAARQLIADIVPDAGFRLERLPAGHDIYRAETLFADNPPELWGVDFGCRTAIVYAPSDHACRWGAWNRALKDTYTRPVMTDVVTSMQLGANVISYATGRELLDKLSAPEAVRDSEESLRDNPLPLARLRHAGGWDAAPGALRNLLKALQAFGVEAPTTAPTVSAADDDLYKYPLLYTHGRRNFSLEETEIDALKTYLANGGTLFADACCGAEAFDTSFRELVRQVTGEELTRIPADDELFLLPGGHDLRQVRRRVPSSDPGERLAAREEVGEPLMEGVRVGDRLVVIYSKYDLSCALERQTTVSCAGYIAEDAVRLATNVVLYTIFQDVSHVAEPAGTGKSGDNGADAGDNLRRGREI